MMTTTVLSTDYKFDVILFKIPETHNQFLEESIILSVAVDFHIMRILKNIHIDVISEKFQIKNYFA